MIAANRLADLNGHPATPPAVESPPTPPLAPPAPPTPTPEERDPATGKWLPGNRAGRGNPYHRKLAAARQAFTDAVTAEDLAGLARSLLKRANEGDMVAAQMLLIYCLGKPTAAADPDRVDHNEANLFLSWPKSTHVLHAIMAGIDPARAAEMIPRAFGSITDHTARLKIPGSGELLMAAQEADARRDPVKE